MLSRAMTTQSGVVERFDLDQILLKMGLSISSKSVKQNLVFSLNAQSSNSSESTALLSELMKKEFAAQEKWHAQRFFVTSSISQISSQTL